MNGDGQVTAADTPAVATSRRRNSITAPVVIPGNLSISLPSKFPNGSAASCPLLTPRELLITDNSAAATHLKGSPALSSSLAYTSLRDILPTLSSPTIKSPTAAASASGRSSYEIPIRNRLVKQAAWAYLRPVSASADSSGSSLVQRLWLRLYSSVNACLNVIGQHVIPSVARAIHQMLGTLVCCCSTG
ncbi:hypothetical protein SAY86_021676 [Trapa natans]|uniref:Uncharacterized protein n=1 Tax=Trapa natans TaxID=22666 RepID=A0AAN7M941_TRANT|nr:hypothetical protein SAY86_021676 [Trapa natans]